MSLPNALFTAFKAAVLAETDGALVALRTANNEEGMANWYNQLSSPAFIAWRSSVSQDEIMLNGFDWTRVDNLSVGKARVWEWLFSNQAKTINPSKANVRAGIDQTWQGTPQDLDVRAAVYVHCKRQATRVERIFATGTGSDAVPGSFGFEGLVTPQNVSDAMRS